MSDVKIRIPKGWIKVLPSERIDYNCQFVDTGWRTPTFPCTGFKAGEMPSARVYIRRIAPKQRRAKG